jgi:hypothetical protein
MARRTEFLLLYDLLSKSLFFSIFGIFCDDYRVDFFNTKYLALICVISLWVPLYDTRDYVPIIAQHVQIALILIC